MKIVATILFVIALLGGLLMMVKCNNEASALAEIEANPMGGLVKSMMGDLPTAGDFKMGSYMAIGLMLTSLFGIVASFMKSKNIGFAGAGAVALFSILLIVFVPSLDGGKYGGPNPKTVAMIVGVIGLIGAGVLGFVASKRTA